MSDLNQIRADTQWYLQQWPESCLRRRATATYDNAGIATETWTTSLSFTGDFQALTGREMEAEAGLEHHSECKIITEYDSDVTFHDRVERYDTDGSYTTYRVNYPRVHEDHRSVFVYREIDQP